VRCADARSRERDNPEGVTQGFHVCLYKVEPGIGSLACNLFSKNDCRAALANEAVKFGPQVPVVGESVAASCSTEWLAGTAS
jgi:hypothetical protein